jgi:hypothetical protein
MITTENVISRDGVAFVVKIYTTNPVAAMVALGAEIRFAATKTAVELDKFGTDYQRADLLDPAAYDAFSGYDLPFTQSPRLPDTHRIAGPQERRAAFTLIKGGKS